MSIRHEDPDADQAGRDAGWLTGLLDAEAGRYSPDGRQIRAAMNERMRDGRHRVPRTRLSWIPAGIVAATLVAAAAVAVIVTAETRQTPTGSSLAAANGSPHPASRNPVAASSAQAGGRATQSAVGDRPIPASVAPTSSSSSSSSSPSAGAGAELVSATGTVSPGNNPYWIQEVLSVTLGEPVTAFQLTVKVARSAGVASTGYWTTYAPAIFDVTVAARANAVTYVFTLKPGHTLQAGSAAFAVQFNHGVSFNPAADTYALSVTGLEQHAAVRGAALGAF